MKSQNWPVVAAASVFAGYTALVFVSRTRHASHRRTRDGRVRTGRHRGTDVAVNARRARKAALTKFGFLAVALGYLGWRSIGVRP
jgi:hypothetical protein